jgi:hypothetical protein
MKHSQCPSCHWDLAYTKLPEDDVHTQFYSSPHFMTCINPGCDHFDGLWLAMKDEIPEEAK